MLLGGWHAQAPNPMNCVQEIPQLCATRPKAGTIWDQDYMQHTNMSIRGALQIAYGTKSFPVPLNHLTIDSIRCPFINQLLGWYCDNRDDEVPDGVIKDFIFAMNCESIQVNSASKSLENQRWKKQKKDIWYWIDDYYVAFMTFSCSSVALGSLC